MTTQARQPGGTPAGGQYAPDHRARAQTNLEPPPGDGQPDRSSYQAALAGYEAAEQRLEIEAGKVLAAHVREHYPDAVSVSLRWSDSLHGVSYGFGVFDEHGTNIEQALEDADEDAYTAFTDGVNEVAWYLRRRLDDVDVESVVVPLAELEAATMEGADGGTT